MKILKNYHKEKVMSINDYKNNVMLLHYIATAYLFRQINRYQLMEELTNIYNELKDVGVSEEVKG